MLDQTIPAEQRQGVVFDGQRLYAPKVGKGSIRLALSGVSAGYSDTAEVIRGFDGTVAEGKLCALIGPNGSGKSTLLRVIAGLLGPRDGTVQIDGDDITRLSQRERAQRIAFVPQRSEMAFGFTVEEVVAMGRAPHQGTFMRPQQTDRDVVERTLAACRLEPLRRRQLATLSGGEQQRVQLARALAQEPRLLLLDEAAAHLDVRHREEVYALVRSEVRDSGLTCVAAMHDFNTALRHADIAFVMRSGELAGHGPVAEVLTPELLSDVFAVPLRQVPVPGGGSVLAIGSDGVPESVPDGHIDL